MNQQELRCFVEVARTRNFSKAAENLFVSQPTISNHVKHLEHELGVRLFNRTYHNVSLTTYGNFLLPAAKQILAIHDSLLNRIRTLQEIEGKKNSTLKLKFGIYTNEDKNNILRVIKLFKNEFPNISIFIDNTIEYNMLEKLKAGVIDIAEGMIIPDKKVEWKFLYNDRYVIYISDRFLQQNQKSISLNQLKGKKMLIPSYKGIPSYKKKQEELFRWSDSIKIDPIETGLANLNLSDSFMFLPESGIQVDDPHIKKVILKDLDSKVNYFPVGISYLKENNNPAIGMFLRFQELIEKN